MAAALISGLVIVITVVILIRKRSTCKRRIRSSKVHPLIQVQPATIEQQVTHLTNELHQATDELRKAREQLARQTEFSKSSAMLPCKPVCNDKIDVLKGSNYPVSYCAGTRRNNAGSFRMVSSYSRSTRLGSGCTVFTNHSNDANSID